MEGPCHCSRPRAGRCAAPSVRRAQHPTPTTSCRIVAGASMRTGDARGGRVSLTLVLPETNPN